MADKIKVAVMGASGRMGQALIRAVVADTGMVLIGATERIGHNWIGRDVGACLGGADMGAMVVADAADLFIIADVVIDFTNREIGIYHATLAAQARCVLVVGTTGFTNDELRGLRIAGQHARIIHSGNMSVGVNLLAALTQQVAHALDDSFDIEVVESHHRHKVDAPSGTALMLGVAAATGRGVVLDDVAKYERYGSNLPARGQGEIGFNSIRGGDIVGKHDVIFAADGEQVVLRHVATDRNIFVRGALRAARWGLDKPAGYYTMYDVLGIRGDYLKIKL